MRGKICFEEDVDDKMLPFTFDLDSEYLTMIGGKEDAEKLRVGLCGCILLGN